MSPSRAEREPRQSLVYILILANILVPVAILTFATGFFPYKPFLPGLAQHDSLDYGKAAPAPFNRLILMVVDALRR
jgi:ethanolamine phosphate transferase 2 subunit G